MNGAGHAILVLAYLGLLLGVVVLWPRARSPRRAALVTLGIVGALAAVHEALFDTLSEDAFITYRYALNIVQGHGPVFNVGRHVEGYSNFLWMIVIAVPHWVAGVSIVESARGLGSILAVATVGLTYAVAARQAGNRQAGLIAAILTAAIGSFVAWGPSGLEVPLFSLLLVSALLVLSHRQYLVAGLLLGLATMTRLDAVVVVVVVGLWVLAWPGSEFRVRLRSFALLAVGVGVLVAPWTIWRVDYYGYLVPNAVAAKSGMPLARQLHLGLGYFNSFAISILPVILLGAIALAFFLPKIRQTDPELLAFWALLVGVVIVFTLYVILVGGDWMPAFRFFAPIVPVLVLAIVLAFSWGLGPDAKRVLASRATIAVVATAVALLLVVDFSDVRLIQDVRGHRVDVEQTADVGAWFHSTLPTGTTIATFPNGAISYNAGTGMQMIDMWGLTDEHIARHGKRIPDGAPGHFAYETSTSRRGGRTSCSQICKDWTRRRHA